jgi:hypothetical protein
MALDVKSFVELHARASRVEIEPEERDGPLRSAIVGDGPGRGVAAYQAGSDPRATRGGRWPIPRSEIVGSRHDGRALDPGRFGAGTGESPGPIEEV